MSGPVNEAKQEIKSRDEKKSELHRVLYGCMGRIKVLMGFFTNEEIMDDVEHWDYTVFRQIADMIKEENDDLDHMNALLLSISN